MNREWLRVLLGDGPRFDVGVGAIGSSARQFFMTGAAHALKQRGVTAPRLLEIGSWIGYSTFTWVQAIEAFFDARGAIACVDPWADYPIVNQTHRPEMVGVYRSMLASGLTYELFMHNISYLPKGVLVQPLRGRSQDILPLLRERSFDLIYIDGDHSYGAVRHDIEAALPLLKPGGILCGDDLDLSAEECDLEHARANRDAQPARDPKTGQMFHPGVTLAVRDVLGSVANYAGFWAVSVGERGAAPLRLEGASCFIPRHLPPQDAAVLREELVQRGLVK
jgi:predicted O-methyltransferase YrrM